MFLCYSYIKNEIRENFKNTKVFWSIINRITGKIIKSIDEILFKALNNKRAKELSNKFANEFQHT